MVVLESTLTCPACGTAKTETMPTDACQFFYECTGCGELLRPKSGDCCVFCSYGSIACPPVQEVGEGGRCCEAALTGNVIRFSGAERKSAFGALQSVADDVTYG